MEAAGGIVTSTPAQRQRYREKYPDRIKEQRRKHLEKKFAQKVGAVEFLEKRMRGDFCRLTRLMFDDVLEKKCASCGTERDLQIHHRQYRLPIVQEDLVRLCRRCHVEEHQRVPPTRFGGETV